MFKKILVAIDKADASRRAFDEALSLAQKLGAQLRLLHVLSFSDPNSPNRLMLYSSSAQLNEKLMKQYEQNWNEFVADYGQYLQTLVREAQARGVEANQHQAYGNAGQLTCDTAQEWGADLIVLGSHRRSGFKELLLGSVSNYVMHHAPCTVLVVHPEAETALEMNSLETASLSA
jgi:nucleotide-binding universal stress UspA family protein